MDFVDSYTKSGGRITDLSRARELAERIGSPEKRLKFVHIAGTNGKGSTLEYISNALIDAGYRTGQFTSPYVLRYSDRIRINGQEIDEKSLCEMAERVKSAVGDKPYSQFEITMAIALLWFEREKCDVVVFETGIGGLLDSTNIIPPPLVSVITSISLDHTAILGKTVEEIAEQKAGIIKGGSAVVLAEDNPDSVKELVRKKAESVGAEFVEPEPCRPYGDGGMFSSFYYRGVRLRPSMPGVHQLYNAQTAITVCLYLRSKGFEISDGSIIRAVENTQVRARLQYIDGEPPVLVDGGHNPAGVAALTMMLMYLSSRGKKIFAVMGMVDSKDYAECVKSVAGCADAVYAVEGFAPNSVPAETIADIASFYTETGTGSLAECAAKAKERSLAENGVAVICGSLYLASEYLNSMNN